MLFQLVKFCLVGACGFVVDAVSFYFVHYLMGCDAFVSRMAAFAVAANVTWLGNKVYTFALANQRQAGLLKSGAQWCRHMATAVFSAIPNMAVFSLIVSLTPPDPMLTSIGFVLGVGVGMVSNFVLSRQWVFKAEHPKYV